YLALKPPSAEKLYAAIDAAGTPDAKLEAATKYLEKYGDQPGEMTDKAAVAFREATVRKREDQLGKRFAHKLAKPDDADDPGAYAGAWEGMEAERAGRLKDAEDAWTRVKTIFPEEAKLPFALKEDVLNKARWGWVADKRLSDIRRVALQTNTLKEEMTGTATFAAPF